MDETMLDIIAEVTKIVFGGGLIALVWTWRSDRLAQYRYLDTAYRELLALYAKTPHFGDPSLTKTYKSSFQGARLEYHYFAMSVHNFAETIYDTVWWPSCNKEWRYILRHHSVLHSQWLNDNKGPYERRYVRFVEKVQRRLAAGATPVALPPLPEVASDANSWASYLDG